MRLVCPLCSGIASAEAWHNEPLIRQTMAMVAELPRGIALRCWNYAGMFRPRGGRGLSWKRALRLITELRDMALEPYIAYNHQPSRPNNEQAWAEALERMIQRPPRQLPLPNHNYLRAIVYEICNEADKKREQAHRKAENSGNAVKDRHKRTGRPKPSSMSIEKMRAIREKNMGRRRRHIDQNGQ